MQSYYQKNKEKWNDKYLKKGYEKIKCDVCDCMIRRKHKSRHERTKKHQRNLNTPKVDVLQDYIKKLNETLLKSGLTPPDVSI